MEDRQKHLNKEGENLAVIRQVEAVLVRTKIHIQIIVSKILTIASMEAIRLQISLKNPQAITEEATERVDSKEVKTLFHHNFSVIQIFTPLISSIVDGDQVVIPVW